MNNRFVINKTYFTTLNKSFLFTLKKIRDRENHEKKKN